MLKQWRSTKPELGLGGIAVPPVTAYRPFSHEIVLGDGSGSMEDIGFAPNRSKLELAIESILLFLCAKLERYPDSFAALAVFSDDAWLLCPFLHLGTQFASIRGALEQMLRVPHRGTIMAGGLRLVSQLLSENGLFKPRADAGRCETPATRLILYSDGIDQGPHAAVAEADQLKSRGLFIECLGVGESPTQVDEALMKRIATRDSDGIVHYRYLGNPEEMKTTFHRLGTGTLTFHE